MKLKSILITLTAFMMAGTLHAQTTGAVTVNGTNPAAISVTNTGDATLSTTIALGSLTPTSGGTLSTGTFQVRLRSNKAYVLSAQASALSFTGLDAADGGETIALSDIGFGITTLVNTGANVANSGSRSDTVAALFDRSGGWPSVTNGLSPFVSGTHGTLNDVASNSQVLDGSRISTKGNISTNNNFILATFGIAVLPQYHTPNTDFSTTITLTMTAP